MKRVCVCELLTKYTYHIHKKIMHFRDLLTRLQARVHNLLLWGTVEPMTYPIYLVCAASVYPIQSTSSDDVNQYRMI
jgi:hypothetical protein